MERRRRPALGPRRVSRGRSGGLDGAEQALHRRLLDRRLRSGARQDHLRRPDHAPGADPRGAGARALRRGHLEQHHRRRSGRRRLCHHRQPSGRPQAGSAWAGGGGVRRVHAAGPGSLAGPQLQLVRRFGLRCFAHPPHRRRRDAARLRAEQGRQPLRLEARRALGRPHLDAQDRGRRRSRRGARQHRRAHLRERRPLRGRRTDLERRAWHRPGSRPRHRHALVETRHARLRPSGHGHGGRRARGPGHRAGIQPGERPAHARIAQRAHGSCAQDLHRKRRPLGRAHARSRSSPLHEQLRDPDRAGGPGLSQRRRDGRWRP